VEKDSGKGGPEAVLFGLLDWQAKLGLDQVTLLIMLSLVNLTVLLGLVDRHLGGDAWTVSVPGGHTPAGPMPALLSALGGGGMEGLLQMAGGLLKDVDPAMLAALLGPLVAGLTGKGGPGAPTT
jgi:hypothetical protein